MVLAASYFQILAAIQGAKQGQGIAVPSELKMSLARKHAQFRSSQQQDAQEFLRCFLESLNEETNRITQKPEYKEIDFDNLALD